MVFFNTKVATKEIKDALMRNSELAFLVKNDFIIECTGDTNQMQRENVRAEFKEGKKKVLLCTDVLQRGLDFRKVRAIVHYGLPADPSGVFKEERYIIIIKSISYF
jgi:superfamily II DNA/RNA helicase